MLAELWSNLQKFFSPYTFEDFVRDAQPTSIQELEALERQYNWYRNQYTANN